MPNIKKGKVITVTSMKGGVGKTISTLLFASIYNKEKKKILIMDLDLYGGDIAFALNLDVKRTIYNLCDDIANNRYKSDSVYNYIVKYNDYIDILSSPKDPRQASKIDSKYIEMIIRRFINNYDVILIDTSHILGVNNMVAFENSNSIINIFSEDSFDLKATKNFVSICKNINVDNLYLVLNTAINTRKKYFSIQNIELIIKRNINYIIESNFYIKNLDKSIIEGQILNVIDKIIKRNTSENVSLTKFLLDLLEDKVGGKDNEEE